MKIVLDISDTEAENWENWLRKKYDSEKAPFEELIKNAVLDAVAEEARKTMEDGNQYFGFLGD